MKKKILYFVKAYYPEIKMGAGAVIAICATGGMCKDTLKAEKVLDTYKEKCEIIAEAREKCPDEYSAKDEKRDKGIMIFWLIRNLAKKYAFNIALYILGFGLMFSSNADHKANHMSASAALALVNEAYNAYRRRVVEKYGEDADRDLALGLEQKKVSIETIDEEGKTKKSSKFVPYKSGKMDETSKNPFLMGAYTYIWDNGSSCEFDDNDPFWNKNFLGQAQEWARNLIIARSDSATNTPGYLFLDEVLKTLGMELSRADNEFERSAGWLYFPNGDNPYGDNFVDFGLMETMRDPNGDICFMNADAINGYEPAWLLNFNCQGDIRGLMRKYA